MAEVTKTNRNVNKLKWPEALKLLQDMKLDQKCGDLIEAADESYCGRNKPFVFFAKYNFGDHIIKKKQFILPNSDSTFSDLPTDVVPVCLVLSQQAEVYLPYYGKSDLPRSLRLLEPGNLFGVFEVANRLLGKEHPIQDWCVSAGSRTVRLLYPLENKAVARYVRKEARFNLSNAPDAYRRGNKHLEDWTWYLMVGLSRKYASDWCMEVLIFPDFWCEGDHGLKFRYEVLRTAFEQLQVDNVRAIRDIAIEDAAKNSEGYLSTMLEEGDVDPRGAIQLLTLLDDVASGRAVAYVPFTGDGKTGPSGPFDKIIANIDKPLIRMRRVQKVEDRIVPVVLVPTYLAPGEHGYVSLSRPTLKRADIELKKSDRMTNFLSTVGDYISRPQISKELEALIPELDWSKLCFYAQISDNRPHFKQVKDIQLDEKNIHTSNAFFLHSVDIKRRS